MGFTTRRPEVSCHPGAAAPGRAHGDLGGALLLRRRRRRPAPAKAASPATRGPTATRSCASGSTRSAGGSAATYRVLVDENDHVDREGAVRAGVAFYGKNTLAITRRHGSWVVLGTLVSDRARRAVRAARRRLRLVHALHRRLPDRRARRAGDARLDPLPLLLDAGAGCDSRRATAPSSARPSTAATSARTSARGTAASRSGGRDVQPPPGAEPAVSLLDWLEADGDELVARYDRLYVPRNDPRWLRRNALVAAGNVGGEREREAVADVRDRRGRAAARARRLGAGTDRRAERAVKLIRNLCLRPHRARAAGARQDPDRPRRLPHGRVRAGGLDAARRSSPRSRSSSSRSSYRWRGRLRYLAGSGRGHRLRRHLGA